MTRITYSTNTVLLAAMLTFSGVIVTVQAPDPGVRHIEEYNDDIDVIGPCQSDDECAVNYVCLEGAGTCEPCLAWSGLDDAPVACEDILKPMFGNGDDVIDYYGDDSVIDIKPCTAEWDCPLGKWCYADAGTCESCSDLCHSQHEACEQECSNWLTDKRNSEYMTIVIAVTVAVVGVVTFIAVTIVVYRCRRNIKHGTQEEGLPSPQDV